MKLPISWLKKYIDVKLSPERLEEVLTMSGSKVEALEMKGAEAVIDIEVTTNRPDCLSILGLAHELSALTGKNVTLPNSYEAMSSRASRRRVEGSSERKGAVQQFQISVEEKKACPLYTARLIINISVKPAPAEEKKFLELTGTRAISNVVDATNFVLFESGQPLHAFDFDKIKGQRITVRYSRKGEKFLGIDGVEYELDDKTLVIADDERPIAIAGVIGGKLTEVTESTQNILLESAYFDPALVRQASRKYKISTDSSYRFERGVDPVGVLTASRRASELITSWAGGQDVSGLVEKNSLSKKKLSTIVLRLSRIEKILGMSVSQKRVLGILKALSLQAKPLGKDRVSVQPSSFRRDIVQEVDLIEEILRIEGFDKIPMVIPPTSHTLEDPQSIKAAGTFELKKFLAALGFSEIITYSLMSAKILKDSGFELQQSHRVVNTTSAAQEFFRPSLMPGMLECALFNNYRKASSLKLFEVGNRYQGGKEETVLGILISGLFENHWRRKTDASLYELKGVLANLLKFSGVNEWVWRDEEKAADGLGQSTGIFTQNKTVGYAGPVSAPVLKNFDISRDVFYAEIVLDEILISTDKALKVQPVPKFPLVRRDLAFVAEEKIQVADFESAMKDAAGPSLREAALFDQYIGKNIAPGKRSLAFSLAYQKETGTFTDAEIQALQDSVAQALKARYAVEFRA